MLQKELANRMVSKGYKQELHTKVQPKINQLQEVIQRKLQLCTNSDS